MSYVIGLDIGTTSTKAVLFDTIGRVMSEHEEKYPIYYPTINWAEQDPLQIEKAAIHALKIILEKFPVERAQLKGIGISSAMHSLVCTTKEGTPLSNLIIWADARSVVEAEKLKETRSELYFQTGVPLHPMTPLAKLTWMKNKKDKSYIQAEKYISIKEFLIKRWFNQEVVDYSIAAATGLFDVQQLKWNEHALKEAGIAEENLFTPVPPTYQLNELQPDIAKDIGISVDTPFIIGASDGPLANLGVGATDPNETAVTIGTSGAIRRFTSEPSLNKKQEVFSYRFDEDRWITGGASNNGGIVLAWLQSIFTTNTSSVTMDEMNALASMSTAGANKLLFLPYITGERAPIWDSQSRGTYIGLSSTHQKGDMIRAAMEGVIFNIYQIGQALQSLSHENGKLFANGGFAKSKLWVQILADVFGQPVYLPESHQSSAWGAAWVALYSLGETASLSEIKHVIPMKETIEPNLTNHRVYKDIFEVYNEVYIQLKGTFRKLASL